TEDADYRAVTRVRRLDDAYLLKPGETIHAITRERLRLPPDISGWLEGRSRFARLGLMVHVTSGFVAPGVNSRQVLEMSNVADRRGASLGVALHRRPSPAARIATHHLRLTHVAFSRPPPLFCRPRVLSRRQPIAIDEGEVTPGDGTLDAKALRT